MTFQRVEIQVQDPQNATGNFDLNIGVFPNASPIALIQSPEEGMPLYKGVPVESFLIFQMKIMMFLS